MVGSYSGLPGKVFTSAGATRGPGCAGSSFSPPKPGGGPNPGPGRPPAGRSFFSDSRAASRSAAFNRPSLSLSNFLTSLRSCPIGPPGPPGPPGPKPGGGPMRRFMTAARVSASSEPFLRGIGFARRSARRPGGFLGGDPAVLVRIGSLDDRGGHEGPGAEVARRRFVGIDPGRGSDQPVHGAPQLGGVERTPLAGVGIADEPLGGLARLFRREAPVLVVVSLLDDERGQEHPRPKARRWTVGTRSRSFRTRRRAWILAGIAGILEPDRPEQKKKDRSRGDEQGRPEDQSQHGMTR